MNNKDCTYCIKKKLIYCPNSKMCYETENKPFFQDRIMLLEEHENLKKQFRQKDKAIDECIELLKSIIMKPTPFFKNLEGSIMAPKEVADELLEKLQQAKGGCDEQ